MQRANVTRKKDLQIVMRARARLGWAYALDKVGRVHTKCGARSLCGAVASVQRYQDLKAGRLLRKRGVACKACRDLAKAKLMHSGAIITETKQYWLRPEFVGGSNDCDFGLFGPEGVAHE